MGDQGTAIISPLAAFNASTRRDRAELPDMTFTAPGASGRSDLLQVGLISKIYIAAIVTFTTGTGASGTWDSNYFPYNLFSNIALRTNEGVEIYRSRGYANQLVQQTMRLGYNPGISAAPASSNVGTTGPKPSFYAPTGAIAASTTYKAQVNYIIPVAIDDAGSAGLLLMQNQAVKASLEMQLGQWADWGISTPGTGASVSVTVKTMTEFFAIPANGALPNLDFVHRIIEETVPYTASGDQLIRVTPGGIITQMLLDVQNNGAPLAFYGTANDPTTANISNVFVRYAGTVTPELYSFVHQCPMNRYLYANDLPNGVIPFEFGAGGGGIEAGFNARDTYDTSALTEFLVGFTTSVSPTAGKIYAIREELQRRG